jgi:hypothetical protein
MAIHARSRDVAQLAEDQIDRDVIVAALGDDQIGQRFDGSTNCKCIGRTVA